jgi:thiamine-phosphate pyrophosphorylase
MPRPEFQLRGVYAIADAALIPETRLLSAVELAIQGGAALVQYRGKSMAFERQCEQASALQALCHLNGIPLIVNDNIELALACNAAGIHLGREDTDLRTARETLGNNAIIGVSCYNEIDRAFNAQSSGADYVAFGSVYPSPTKPQAVRASIELCQQAKQQITIPVCAIGGITAANAKPLVEIGIDLLAVISGIFAQPDIEAATRDLSRLYHN